MSCQLISTCRFKTFDILPGTVSRQHPLTAVHLSLPSKVAPSCLFAGLFKCGKQAKTGFTHLSLAATDHSTHFHHICALPLPLSRALLDAANRHGLKATTNYWRVNVANLVIFNMCVQSVPFATAYDLFYDTVSSESWGAPLDLDSVHNHLIID